MKTDALVAEQNRAEFHAGGEFELALHRARPEGHDQASHELTLPGYGRARVPRSAEAWSLDVPGRSTRNAVLVRFPTITAGKDTARWLSIGSGGRLRRLVELAEPLDLSANRRVEFEPGNIEIVEGA